MRDKTPLTLNANEVAVWTISLDQPVAVRDHLISLLATSERQRADRFRSPSAHTQFIIGRGALRVLLGRYLHIDPTSIAFESTPKGKPFLSPKQHGVPLEFNLSHSGDMAAIAVTHNRVLGIDIEQIREINEFAALVNRFFSAAECDEFATLEPDLKLHGFFRTWTRKEAFIKATGQGLSRALESFDVGVHPQSAPGLRRVADDPDEPSRWSMFDFTPRDDIFGSLVVAGTGLHVTFRHFNPEADL